MSDYLQKIIYLTQSQYETLADGGTVGSYTGLNENYIYVTNGLMTTADLGNIIVPVSKGGTGAASWASGKILVGNGSNTFTTIDKDSANTANTLVQRNSSGNFSAGTITATLNGNAATATKFSSNASITLSGDTTGSSSSVKDWAITTTTSKLTYQAQLTSQEAIDNFLTASKFQVATFKTTDQNNLSMTSNDGIIISIPWSSTTYGAQLAFDDTITGAMKFRGKSTNWGDWRTVLHDGNYTNYTVTKTGSGASGTWNIDISGIAAKATADANGNNIVNTYATKSTVNGLLAAADAMIFKGTLGTGGTVTSLPNSHEAGWTYKVITAGTYAGQVCEIGDMIVCITDGTAANNAHWTVIQTNTDGAVIGPSSSTDGNIVLFDGTTGKIIKNSTYSPSSFAAASHGTHVTTATVQSALSINTSSGSTSKCLTEKGTFVAFNNYSHPTGDGNLHVPATGASNNGKFLKAGSTAGSASWSDLPAASDSVAGITKVGASGGAAAYSHGTHVTTSTVQSALSINTSSGSTSKCLTEKGTFESFNNYSLPLAANGTRGGIQIGYSESGTNYAVKLSSEKAYVSVPWTDTKVTSSSNHYSPTTASGSDKTASASGATAAWSIDVVKGITINTDGKGHITGLSVTSGKIPANPNTDTKVKQSAITTADWRKVLLHYKNDTTSTAAVTDSTEQVYGCVGISAQASTGTLRASNYNVNDKVTLQWNDTDQSLDFVFI